MNKNILIVDDELDIRTLLKGVLEDEGYSCHQAKNSDEALTIVNQSMPNLVLLDVWLEDSTLDGIGILETLVKSNPELPIVMMSGHGTIETAVSAIKLGAYDFIEKPFDIDLILMAIGRALEVGNLKKENRELRAKANNANSDINGISTQINNLRQTIEKVAPTESRVLITGAQGTGKNVVARMIHKLSPRSNAPFISINCASVHIDGLEAALFGVGNNNIADNQTGVIEQAYGGTLVLDEIAEMPLEVQGKLVRVLQENNFTPINSTKSKDIDIRLIATTSQNLNDKIENGSFREDLYYRLSVVPLEIPALIDRRMDIPVLAEYFLNSQEIFDEHNITLSAPLVLSEDALAILQAYSWPGNIRQLKNVMEWLLIMYGHQVIDKNNKDNNEIIITAEMLPPELRQMPKSFKGEDPVIEMMTKPLREAREVFERRYLLAQIERFDGNISKTAGFIGMERSALHRKLKTLVVDTDDSKGNQGVSL